MDPQAQGPGARVHEVRSTRRARLHEPPISDPDVRILARAPRSGPRAWVHKLGSTSHRFRIWMYTYSPEKLYGTLTAKLFGEYIYILYIYLYTY